MVYNIKLLLMLFFTICSSCTEKQKDGYKTVPHNSPMDKEPSNNSVDTPQSEDMDKALQPEETLLNTSIVINNKPNRSIIGSKVTLNYQVQGQNDFDLIAFYVEEEGSCGEFGSQDFKTIINGEVLLLDFPSEIYTAAKDVVLCISAYDSANEIWPEDRLITQIPMRLHKRPVIEDGSVVVNPFSLPPPVIEGTNLATQCTFDIVANPSPDIAGYVMFFEQRTLANIADIANELVPNDFIYQNPEESIIMDVRELGMIATGEPDAAKPRYVGNVRAVPQADGILLRARAFPPPGIDSILGRNLSVLLFAYNSEYVFSNPVVINTDLKEDQY